MLPSARRLSLPPPSLPHTISSILTTTPIGAVPAKIHGWIRSVREHKNVAFIEVDDGSGAAIQAVLKDGRAIGLTQGSAVLLSGSLVPSRGSDQAVELLVDERTLLGKCDLDSYPIQKKALPHSVLREHAHLRFRTSGTGAVMRLRDALARDWHDWFEENEFVHIHTPILTSSDCEGAGEVFTVAQSLPNSATQPSLSPSLTPTPSKPPFFPRPVNLTVSSQLHLEAPTHSLSRVYTLSPSFRAEHSMTSRHLAEFYMLEAEVAFVTNLSALLDLVERAIRVVLERLLQSSTSRAMRERRDLALIAIDTSHLSRTADHDFARISYTEAVSVLSTRHAEVPFDHTPTWGEGLSSEHEKWLAGEHFGRPVFVTDYPATLKPFYMLPSDAAESGTHSAPGQTVACFDLLFPGIGEIAGGSLREYRIEALLDAIKKAGLNEDDYSWYLDLRRFGSVPHGGWGMGWERWICWVSGISNVRDVVAFPRWAGSCRF